MANLLSEFVLYALTSVSPTSHLSALTSGMSLFAPGFAVTHTASRATSTLALTRSRTKTSKPQPAAVRDTVLPCSGSSKPIRLSAARPQRQLFGGPC